MRFFAMLREELADDYLETVEKTACARSGAAWGAESG